MKIIDSVILGIILLCSGRGGYYGFWLTGARLLGTLMAAGASWFLQPALKAWLKEEPQLITGFQKSLLGPFLEEVSPEGAQGVLLKLADVLDHSNLPGFIKKMLIQSGNPSEGVMASINETTLTLISYIVLLLGTILIIQILAVILDRFFKLTGLSFLNRAGGVVAGASEGLFLTWVLLSVLTPWISFRPEGFMAEAVRGGSVSNWLYQHNYLLTIIDFTLK